MTVSLVPSVPAQPADRDDRLLVHLRATAAGDDRAFERLHAELHPITLAFALRMLGRYDRAEEVANDAMLAVWRGAASFEGRSKVTTWVFGIAYRMALRSRRRFGFERLHETIDALLRTADPAAPGADALLSAGRLTDAIATLPPAARALVHMTYYYGFTAREIGEVMEVSENTVKTRLAAARRRMERALGPDAEGRA